MTKNLLKFTTDIKNKKVEEFLKDTNLWLKEKEIKKISKEDINSIYKRVINILNNDKVLVLDINTLHFNYIK